MSVPCEQGGLGSRAGSSAGELRFGDRSGAGAGAGSMSHHFESDWTEMDDGFRSFSFLANWMLRSSMLPAPVLRPPDTGIPP